MSEVDAIIRNKDEQYDWLHRQWESLRQAHEQLKFDVREIANEMDCHAPVQVSLYYGNKLRASCWDNR